MLPYTSVTLNSRQVKVDVTCCRPAKVLKSQREHALARAANSVTTKRRRASVPANAQAVPTSLQALYYQVIPPDAANTKAEASTTSTTVVPILSTTHAYLDCGSHLASC